MKYITFLLQAQFQDCFIFIHEDFLWIWWEVRFCCIFWSFSYCFIVYAKMIIFSLYTVGLLGAVIAFILNNNFKMGIVVGSALPSLIFALAVVLLEKYLSIRFVEEAPVIFYGAAFIGMASHKILSSYFLIGIAGLLFTFIYLHTSPYFDGFGGALGTTAALCFLPVWATSLLKKK